MTVIFVLNVNIPDLTSRGVLRTPPPGLFLSCPVHCPRLVRPDRGLSHPRPRP